QERLDLAGRPELQVPVRSRKRHEESGVAESVAVSADRACRVDDDVESTPPLMRVAARAESGVDDALDDVGVVVEARDVLDPHLHCCCCCAAMSIAARATPTRRLGCGSSRRYV